MVVWGSRMWVLALASTGCAAPAFACETPENCRSGGLDGVCEETGWCSFEDPDCASGRRYGSHATPTLAGMCVPPPTDEGSTDSTSGTAESTTSGPTTGSTSGTQDSATASSEDVVSSTESTGDGCSVHRIELRVDGDKVPAQVMEFPLLVSVSDPALVADSDPARVPLFTEADGTSVLSFDLEHHDPVEGHVRAWVRVPTIDPVSGATVLLWPDHDDAVDPVPADVWDPAGYLGVWHLDLEDGDVRDSSGRQPDGWTTGTVVPTPGQIGQAAAFGGDGAIFVETDFAGTLTAFSVSLWLHVSLADDRQPIFRRLNGTNLYPRSNLNAAGQLNLQGRFGADTISMSADYPLRPAGFHHVAYTYDPQSGVARMYFDGVEAAQATLGPGDPDPGINPLELGRDPDLGVFLDGIIDEFRVSGSVRSPAWIRMSHDSQTDPAAFVTVVASIPVPCP
jgi:hypothetical protein